MNSEDWKDEYLKFFLKKNDTEIQFEAAAAFKQRHVPPLFKYRHFDSSGRHLDGLKKDYFWLSSPTNFNDPFDSSLNMMLGEVGNRFAKLNLRELIGTIESPIKFNDDEIEKMQMSPNVLEALFLAVAQKDERFKDLDMSEILPASQEVFDNLISESRDGFSSFVRENLHVCSFTDKNDSILMWSHYGMEHTGFCIEYDFRSLGARDPRFTSLHPVIYSEKVFDVTTWIDPEREDDGTNILMPTLASIHKSPEWKYEKEWRMVFQVGGSVKMNPYPAPKPSAVYLGAKCTTENTATVKGICDSKGIRVYQMKLIPGKFQVQPKEL